MVLNSVQVINSNKFNNAIKQYLAILQQRKFAKVGSIFCHVLQNPPKWQKLKFCQSGEI